MNRLTVRDAVVLFLLVAIGVVGRWAQPEWNFTPIAAIAVFAGYYFSSWIVALLVPLAALAVSNTVLPSYADRGILLAVFVMITAPVLLGVFLRRPCSGVAKMFRGAFCCVAPASAFFVVTNFAVWLVDGARLGYESSTAGLGACYAAAIPFYRTMLAGDAFYLAVLFGAFALAQRFAEMPVRAPN